MNGYSSWAKGLSDQKLATEIAKAQPEGKFSNPAQDIHWKYRALLEEQRDRSRPKCK